MRNWHIAAFFLATVVVASAADRTTIDQLKARAAGAREADQPKLFLEIAEWQLKAADSAYSHGKPDEGKAAVEDVAAYSEKAGNAAAASHKHLKDTEIKLRDLTRRLDALSQTLSFDDRKPLLAAIARMEKVRSELLTAMFGPSS